MKKTLQNNRNNQTAITDQETLKSIWLGIKNDYRTLIGLDNLDITENDDSEEDEENNND
jgi:hypothetical protein